MDTEKTEEKLNELKSLKQNICVTGVLGSGVIALSLFWLMITFRNPDDGTIMGPLACLLPISAVIVDIDENAKKYIQLKKEIKNLQRRTR